MSPRAKTAKDIKMSKTVIRSAYDGSRVQVAVKNTKKSLTIQEQAKLCDIHHILARYVKTGVLDHVSKYEATYGDVTGADYQTMQNQIAAVNSMFMALPAKERAKFDNNPAEFLDYVASEEGKQDIKDGKIDNPDAAEAASENVDPAAGEASKE